MCFHKKIIINILNFFEIDKLFNEYITHHNNKFDLYLINCEFKLEIDNDKTSHKKIYVLIYSYNTHIFDLKIYLLNCISYYILQGYKFHNIKQMIIRTISDRCNMTYKYYLEQPMPMCERRLNMVLTKNPTLINSLNRYHNHPLIRKNSHIP